MPRDDVERQMTRLRRAGWNLREVGTAGGRRLVGGSTGENLLQAEGATTAEACRRSCQEAEAWRMLRRE